MEEASGDTGASEVDTLSDQWLQMNIIDKVQSMDLTSQEHIPDTRSQMFSNDDISPQSASQMLWETGVLSCRIPNGFYSVIPDKMLKARFTTIPTLDELCALGMEGCRTGLILVDSKKDKRVAKLKQFTVASVKGLSSNPALVVKKTAEVVCQFYGGPQLEAGPAKSACEDIAYFQENHGVMLLGQTNSRSCRPRAILFKVLADAVGLRSKLLMGLQTYDKGIPCTDSSKHLSLLVSLNSTEFLVDLMKSPGQLIPFSVKSLVVYHVAGPGESDSTENDSCDSPMEPNSPMFEFSDKLGSESPEQEDNRHEFKDQRREENLSSLAGPSLPNIKLRRIGNTEAKLSVSRSEPDILNSMWRRSRRKVIAEQRTASSSPEHRFMRARGRSVLSGRRHPFVEDAESVSASSPDQSPQHHAVLERSSTVIAQRSPYSVHSPDGKERRRMMHGTWFGRDFSQPAEHISGLESRRVRKRSVSIAPEISDDIVRAVRAMNEALKPDRQQRLTKSEEPILGESSGIFKEKGHISCEDKSENVSDYASSCGALVAGNASNIALTDLAKQESLDRKSVEPSENVDQLNEVLESSLLLSNSLLPFAEWHIEFSELRIGVRVGIGSFGEVFRGIWRGTEVAIKVLLEQDLTRENIEDFCNEIQLLSRMRHPNVILFLGACTKPPHLSMVTEYMEMGSLYYLIHTSGQGEKLSWRRRLKMLRDICRGMMSIQRMNIVHRDLKSANCLVDKHWTVKVCDFGLSRVITDHPMRDSIAAGTPEWMAPELLRNEPFTDKCDVFSLGVIIWELCTLKRPWEGVKPMQVVYAVANEGARLDIPEGPIGNLIADCWAEANDRPTYEEIFTRLHECEFLMS